MSNSAICTEFSVLLTLIFPGKEKGRGRRWMGKKKAQGHGNSNVSIRDKYARSSALTANRPAGGIML